MEPEEALDLIIDMIGYQDLYTTDKYRRILESLYNKGYEDGSNLRDAQCDFR